MTVKPAQPGVKQQAAMWMMIVKQLAASYVWVAIGISILIGIIIGLIFAWLIWPVQWTDAKPSSLSPQYQQAFLNDSANSYAVTGQIDQVAAQLGEGWSTNKNETDLQAVVNILNSMIPANYANNANNITSFRDALQTYGSVGPAGASPKPTGISYGLMVVLTILVLLLGIGVAYVVIRRLRSEKPRAGAPPTTTTVPTEMGPAVVVPAASLAAGGARAVQKTAWPGESRPPLSQFASTYNIGDDRYDMSKAIEAANGDFLGECGVGISETIGTGTPDKVTALEIWLFDKTDVRTITKVLMSEHAFNDAALKTRLAPKGDPVLARVGEVVELHTQSLTIRARIVDLIYGSGGGLPTNSFFQQATLEIASWSDGASG